MGLKAKKRSLSRQLVA